MRIGGLYVLTDAVCCSGAGERRVKAALEGGAAMLQLRCKSASLTPDYGRRLVALGRTFGVPVIVNDDIDLARTIGADGVHLGAQDEGILRARAVLGATAIIGASCYASLTIAEDAVAQGADYLAFGSFFPSRTKPDAVRASPELLRAAGRFNRPLVAIGGILPENGAALLAAGAVALAVIDGVFGQADIVAAARAYQHLFEE